MKTKKKRHSILINRDVINDYLKKKITSEILTVMNEIDGYNWIQYSKIREAWFTIKNKSISETPYNNPKENFQNKTIRTRIKKIKKSSGEDSYLHRNISDLTKLHILERREVKKLKSKKPDVYYRIPEKFRWFLNTSSRRFTDKYLIDNYNYDNTILGNNATIYGLPIESFDPFDPKTRGLKKHTPEYMALESALTVKDLFEVKKGLYKGKIDEKIGIFQAVQRIMQKLDELKKEHRLKILTKNYQTISKRIRDEKIKLFVQRYSDVFLHIINYTDCNKWFLNKFVVEGMCRGGHRVINFNNKEDLEKLRNSIPKKDSKLTNKQLQKKYNIVFNCQGKELWNRNYDFYEKLSKLSKQERKKIAKFLEKVVIKTLYLYPTNIVLVGRSSFDGLLVDNDLYKLK